MSTTNFNIRMDEKLKEEAFPIIESYGLTLAQAVKPNDLTKLAMLELLNNRSENTLVRYSSLDELMADI